ncbi:hypothetical protein BDZ91DRAFT_715740 [Kalaharituber pfeilii]|nr:hypothetical protein BDZ91DRAFT_715740 [Kalaharituber pfeilii]
MSFVFCLVNTLQGCTQQPREHEYKFYVCKVENSLAHAIYKLVHFHAHSTSKNFSCDIMEKPQQKRKKRTGNLKACKSHKL